jgi:hypothetical protein
MRRTTAVVLSALTLLLGMVGMAGAQQVGPDWPGGLPPHGHMRLLHAEWTGPGVGPTTNVLSYGRCVDLADGKVVTIHAHHENLHVGRAGVAQRTGGGHLVVPTAPLTPFANCAELAKALPPR